MKAKKDRIAVNIVEVKNIIVYKIVEEMMPETTTLASLNDCGAMPETLYAKKLITRDKIK